MRSILASLVLLSVSALSAAADTPPLPKGWRFPLAKELSDEKMRNDSPAKFATAIADSNGDGVPDQAFLLKSTKFSGEGLLVWLSNGPGKFRWIVLDTIDWGPKYPNVPLSRGIDIIKPGVLEYICIVKENADDCEPEGEGEGRPKMTLRRPALFHFKFESAGSAFYWDTDARRFILIAVSD